MPFYVVSSAGREAFEDENDAITRAIDLHDTTDRDGVTIQGEDGTLVADTGDIARLAGVRQNYW
ncbi:MAG TPA: hypothetical protein VEH84_01165 [Alphaproteobacteria bacterium]|nr:hypothetical protein [Alphaproteobacteria bacterium]